MNPFELAGRSLKSRAKESLKQLSLSESRFDKALEFLRKRQGVGQIVLHRLLPGLKKDLETFHRQATTLILALAYGPAENKTQTYLILKRYLQHTLSKLDRPIQELVNDFADEGGCLEELPYYDLRTWARGVETHILPPPSTSELGQSMTELVMNLHELSTRLTPQARHPAFDLLHGLCASFEEIQARAEGGSASEEPAEQFVDYVIGQIKELTKPKFEQIRNLGDTLAALPSFKLKDAFSTTFIKQFIGLYFNHLDDLAVAEMLVEILHLPETATDQDKVRAALRRASPGFFKSISQQIAPRLEGNAEELLGFAEKKGRLVPPWLAKELIENNPQGYDFESVGYGGGEVRQGSVAQLHNATLNTPEGQFDTMVRFIKPGMNEVLAAEFETLRKVARDMQPLAEQAQSPLPPLEKLINDVELMVAQDLDLALTINNQTVGESYYETERQVSIGGTKWTLSTSVPDVYRAPNTKAPVVLQVQERFETFDSLKKWHETQPELVSVIVEELCDLFFRCALMGDGFFHSDLHDRNIGIEIDPFKRSIRVFIIDFGMANILDESSQRAFLRTGAGSELKNPKMLSRALKKVVKFEPDSEYLREDVLEEKIRERIEFLNRENRQEMDAAAWVAWAMGLEGVQSPDVLAHFTRAADMVFNLSQLAIPERLRARLTKTLKKALWKKLLGKKGGVPLSWGQIIGIARKALMN